MDYDILFARSTDSGATWTAPAPLNTNASTNSGDDLKPQIATDGAGNWVAVWESRDSLGGTIGPDTDILYARSANNGITWTAPAPLNSNAASGSEDDLVPQVTTDGAGNWVAVWESYDSLGGTIGTDPDILYARSTDSGATWTAATPLNTNAATNSGEDGQPQVTTDGSGTWLAVWESNDSLDGTIGTDFDILFARSTDAGATWTPPAALNANAFVDSAWDQYPQVTTDGAGNWIAVWSTVDILVARSVDSGQSWTAPIVLTAGGAPWAWDEQPQIGTDEAGNWIVVWMSNDDLGGTIGDDFDILFARSEDQGETWTAAAPLNTNAASSSVWDHTPRLAHGGGIWLAVWSSFDSLGGTIGTDADILFARSNDVGITWTDAAPLNTTAATDSAHDRNPQVATDRAGNWLAVWDSTDSLGGTIGTDSDILFMRSDDNGATWTVPAALNTNAGNDSGDDWRPRVTTDGAGTWIVVWESNDSLGGTIGADFDILFARSTDAGATWTDPAPLNTNAATGFGLDRHPQVTSDGVGNWVAVWESNDSLGETIGTDFDILFSRSVDNGATWSAPAALNTNAAIDSGWDERPQVTTDSAGHWVAVWNSTDPLGGTIGTDFDILVARSTNAGATWTDPAPLNTNAATGSGDDRNAQVATDASGNWLAVWHSSDSLEGAIGTDRDILLARSSDAGVSWTAPTPLNTNAATGSGWDENPHITTDGAGNWLVVWDSSDSLGDTIGPDPDILFARSADNGATWTAPAPLNTNAATTTRIDSNPQASTDGSGGWITVWHSTDTLGGTIGTDWDVLFARGCEWPSDLDTDGDGLTDCDEVLVYGTDPLVRDRFDDVDDLLSKRSLNYLCAVPPGPGSGAVRTVFRSDVGRSGTVTLADLTATIGNFDANALTGLAAARADVTCAGVVALDDVTTVISKLDAVVN